MTNDTTIETIEYKGYKIKIYTDDNGYNPREDDNLGTMVFFHKRYDLGDKHNINHDDFNSWEKMEEHLIKNEKAIVILPVYMYDHSGIALNTTGFSCPWDSGQIGFIYTTKEQIKNNFGDKRLTKRFKEWTIEKTLKQEVNTYSDYVNGNVYMIEIESPNGDNIDALSGFYGYDWEKNGILDEAKPIIDNNIQYRQEQKEKEEQYSNIRD